MHTCAHAARPPHTHIKIPSQIYVYMREMRAEEKEVRGRGREREGERDFK